ncbi:glutathione S-transferase family protein [Oceanicola sp. D3]|uniref:glutathione S-transferase family protein n=1 Tax=Oceanicola sp. D3 TaxID=2587163 RepID=UPI0011228C1B|nr:glutathione S-transferase family protein [Oceanicola sp. D3]QDC07857.1 glutathione S-transferase family protein [Oceanicola sp. D3]
MIKFYHAPNSRSSTVAIAIEEMGLSAEIETKIVTVPRQDGTGGPDAANPHPESKVPALEVNGSLITERAAILALLSELFPEAPTAVPPGHPDRGAFLMWLSYYAGVAEPLIMGMVCEVADNPIWVTTYRDMPAMIARLETALDGQDYLLESGFSAADLIMASPYQWNRDWLPKRPAIEAWFDRVVARPAVQAVAARDNA